METELLPGKAGYILLIFFSGYIQLAPRILGPFCLASLGLEGIRSSSFTFDSHVSRNQYKNVFLEFFYFFQCGDFQRRIAACVGNKKNSGHGISYFTHKQMIQGKFDYGKHPKYGLKILQCLYRRLQGGNKVIFQNRVMGRQLRRAIEIKGKYMLSLK